MSMLSGYMEKNQEGKAERIFKKELLSTLKGKSCFHIKDLNPVLLTQIRQTLKDGFDLYKKRGWI